jgi:RNA polymerase sigma factor (TIGR02999 family)
VTQLLALWSKGDQSALNELMPLVYAELRKLADSYLRRERSGHTLQPTALVHEAWIRLVRQDEKSFQNRHRFFAMAAQMMRQILVDHARRVNAQKRGGPAVPLDERQASASGGDQVEEFLVLDEALQALASVSERQSKVIELRYFGGLSGSEISEVMEISAATVSREQRSAEAWLSHFLGDVSRKGG